MDDDPVLRSLSDDVERDDPELAAFLRGTGAASPGPRPGRRQSAARTLASVVLLALLGCALLVSALLLPARVTLGATAMLVILASPLAVCWLLESGDARRP